MDLLLIRKACMICAGNNNDGVPLTQLNMKIVLAGYVENELSDTVIDTHPSAFSHEQETPSI